MKKTIPQVLLLLLLSGTLCAQNKKNDFIINAGFSSGDGHTIKPYPREDGINTFNLNCEYYFNPVISAGLYGIYYRNTYKWESNTAVNYGYKDIWQGFNAGVKTTYHAGSLLKVNTKYIDLYLTAFGGFRNFSYKEVGINSVNIYADLLDYKIHSFSAGGIAGFRYLFSKKWGMYTEVGLSRELFINAGFTLTLAKKSK